jgi:hypothetical protein
MGKKVDQYRNALRECPDWAAYLRANSNLPGPRGNLELAEAVFLEGNRELFLKFIASDSAQVAENTPGVFVVFCGILGLGRLLVGGEKTCFQTLRTYAGDGRWRIREAVAMALQKYGTGDIQGLLAEMRNWMDGSLLEQRAVVAALCEPALLRDAAVAGEVLAILDEITTALSRAGQRKSDDFRVLRQALAYGWSVAAAAEMVAGKAAMERWFTCQDPDVRWLMRENLKKKRLERADSVWVEHWKEICLS